MIKETNWGSQNPLYGTSKCCTCSCHSCSCSCGCDPQQGDSASSLASEMYITEVQNSSANVRVLAPDQWTLSVYIP